MYVNKSGRHGREIAQFSSGQVFIGQGLSHGTRLIGYSYIQISNANKLLKEYFSRISRSIITKSVQQNANQVIFKKFVVVGQVVGHQKVVIGNCRAAGVGGKNEIRCEIIISWE